MDGGQGSARRGRAQGLGCAAQCIRAEDLSSQDGIAARQEIHDHASPATLAIPLALTISPADAQDAPDRPTIWDVITVENLLTSGANMLMSSARALADIRYDQISVDPMAARIDLIGLRIEPLIPGASGPCTINAAQATLNGASLDRITQGRFALVLSDAELSNGCLPAEVAPMARGLGIGQIQASRIEADVNYDYASGGGTLRVIADLERLAALQFSADIDYISYRVNPDKSEPDLAIDLNAAELTVTDLGAWAIGAGFLPESMKQPEALADLVSQRVQDILSDLNGPIDPTLSDEQTAFAEELGAQIAKLPDGGSRVVLSTAISDAPLRISEASLADTKATFAALAPRIGASAPALAQAVPVDVLEAALTAESAPDNTLAMGRALITGTGAPLNVTEGLRLLAPLAEGGNAEASALAAAALEQRDPAAAYAHALRAAAAGAPGMLALLDRLERGMPFDAMMAAQDTALGAAPRPSLDGDVRVASAAMRGYFLGSGYPRSYAAAYYWALIGAAAGDASAVALRGDIEERMRLRGHAAAWREIAANVENVALRDWIGGDIPATLTAGR